MRQENISEGMPAAVAVCIAIPACNEAVEITGCLDAIAQGAGKEAELGVVVFANNCSDATARLARDWARAAAPRGLRLEVLEVDLPSGHANAGRARQRAMARARTSLGRDGLILTTDADSRPPPGWVSEMRFALQAHDLVLGPVLPRPGDSQPRLRGFDRSEREALALQARILRRGGPTGGEAHQHASGASLGMTTSAWDRLGGLPDVACGEDRAVAEAARRAGLRVGHVAIAPVLTSWRLEGRARGGHAETLARRLVEPDPYCDDRILPISALLLCTELLGRLAREGAGSWLTSYGLHPATFTGAATPDQLWTGLCQRDPGGRPEPLRISEVRAMLPALRRLAGAGETGTRPAESA